MNLPTSLKAVAQVPWAGAPHGTGEPVTPDDITIVTAFFDIGREDWQEGNKRQSRFRRSVDDYFANFARLAKIKNQIIVFTEPCFVERVLELRRANGLEERTSIVVIADLFECSLVAPVREAIERRMTDLFRRWVFNPERPECRESCYVSLVALKFAFVCTAIELNLVAANQVAWIDFGYCRDDHRFNPATPWRFDAGDKINLFHIAKLDDAPIYRVVRHGAVYFQACHMVGPAQAWPAFTEDISISLFALLASDLVDDEQTLMLMAWRKNPERYVIHAVAPTDWFIIFQRFYAGALPDTIKLPASPRTRIESPLWEEFRYAFTRLRKDTRRSLKKTFSRHRRIYKWLVSLSQRGEDILRRT